MKAKELRELIDFISNTGLEEVNIETEEFKIKVKRSAEGTPVAAPQAVSLPPVAAPAAAPAAAPTAGKETAPAPASSNLVEVKSPMIGTFYRTPNPESPAFVNVGDKIKPGDTVCIIEAMKLFNEIEAEVSGTIVEILVDNASPVEYDQPLFLVDPS
jgi:acetyl-CoA carboxylase biotin carboxyl carrier protein